MAVSQRAVESGAQNVSDAMNAQPMFRLTGVVDGETAATGSNATVCMALDRL